MFLITPNDGAKIPATLLKDGLTFNIPGGTSVKAALLNNDHTQLLAGPVTVSQSEAGSDWATSGIVAVFSAADLAAITESVPLVMEIEVIDGYALTWYYEGEAQIGLIA